MLWCYHLLRLDQKAALILPFAIFFACLALNDSRRLRYASLSPSFLGEPCTPCCPKRIVFTLSPSLATTICDFFGWSGVRLGLLKPLTPARVSLGSLVAMINHTLHQNVLETQDLHVCFDPCLVSSRTEVQNEAHHTWQLQFQSRSFPSLRNSPSTRVVERVSTCALTSAVSLSACLRIRMAFSTSS